MQRGIYLLTFVTRGRKKLFTNLLLARLVVRHLNSSPYAVTLAFVVMPDHVHWLLQLRRSGSLSRTVQALKILTAKGINTSLGRKGAVWQAGFHDHGCRSHRSLRALARYVVANPVRAGLVSRVGDYPHWDAIWI